MTPAFPPWVLFTSSREVYEETYPDGPLQLLKPVDEDEPCRPINTYGFTKLLGERMLRDASLRSAVARLSNVYGDVEDYLERLVPAFAKAAAKGKPLIVRGSLRKTFDFTHVSDIAKALLLLAIRLQETKTPTTECFNLVSGRGTTLGDLVRLAAKNAGEKLQFIQEPANKSESQFFIGNPRKARDTLGWQAEIAIEDGFSRLVEDFRRKDGEN
jgi:dTDP-glucose 4,6-dehydratase/UDP-glucose 4-epimerase